MTEAADPSAVASAQRQSPLSQWDNEGGALGLVARALPADIPDLTNSELVHLRIRVIALENLMIAVLSQSTAWQLDMADAMAAHIAPRSDAAPHPLTEQAAHHMNELVRRAYRFRDTATE
jgi:hypothetical protein